MPLHPGLQAMLDQAANLPAMETLPVATVRAGAEARYAALPRPEVGSVEDRSIPGPRGDIRIRIYRPQAEGPLPTVVFFHGSGFVICSIDSHDGMCRHICRKTGAVVVSVDYALAPENKFPAGPDDCLAATRWVGTHIAELGGRPDRIALAGDSVGGTFAAVTAIRIRDEGEPHIRAMLLAYPVTDYPDPGTLSYRERARGCGLTSDGMRWFWGHYLTDPSEGAHPHASPYRAEDLSRLPDACIITAEYDVLRDEGELFAGRLQAAGVRVELKRYDDMNHGFLSWTGLIDRADEALDESCSWLRRTLD